MRVDGKGADERRGGEALPPGWRTNPSTWSARLPIVIVALVGLAIAAYLTAFQYGLVATVWEPFFGEGSRIVLTSSLSKVLPISDGALGALGYLADAVTGLIGGTRRWRTSPWIVIVFGIVVGPLGLTSVLLVIAQPTLYGAYCTLCIASAVISVVIIPPAVDEALASLQHIKRVRLAGGSAWKAFWGIGAEQRRLVGASR